MNQLFLDVTAGAAGDMLMGALYALCPEPEAFLHTMHTLGLPGIQICPEPAEDHGICGVRMHVRFHGAEESHSDPSPHHHHSGSHTHHTLAEVLSQIRSFPLPAPVLDDACAVYRLIAGAEARAHGRPVAEVHFHEVGMLDAVADVTGVCLLLHQLRPLRVTATPVAVGSGSVRCAHGVLPIPAPATAFLLEGLPTAPGPSSGELCTPTGAALLRHFVQAFGPVPAEGGQVGRGMGARRFPGHCNAVTARLVPSPG